MKRSCRIAGAVSAGLLLLAGAVQAQAPRAAFSLQGGGAGHEENNIHVGLASGFGFSLPLARRLTATVELAHWSAESRSSFGKLYNGRLALTPVLFGFRYEFGGNGYFTPYAVAGVGYVGSRFRIGPLIMPPEITVEQSVRSGAAGFLGFGASWRLSALLEFFSEMNYLIRNARGETVVRDRNLGVSRSDIWVNLHVVYWKFGLRILF